MNASGLGPQRKWSVPLYAVTWFEASYIARLNKECSSSPRRSYPSSLQLKGSSFGSMDC